MNPKYIDLDVYTANPCITEKGEFNLKIFYPYGKLRGFFLNELLTTRNRLNIPSNNPIFDEDVNMYLAGIMTDAMFPTEGVYTTESSFFKNILKIEKDKTYQPEKEREKFRTYKKRVNYLLIKLGIFKRESENEKRTLHEHLGVVHDYTQKFRRKKLKNNPSQLEEIYSKISLDLEKYLTILKGMNLINERFSNANIKKFIGEGEDIFLNEYDDDEGEEWKKGNIQP